MDKNAELLIHAKIDDFFKVLMTKLDIQTPKFRLERNLIVKIEEGKNGKETLKIHGVDTSGGPFELFKKTQIDGKTSGFSVLSTD